MKDIVAFDVETTGLSAQNDYIIQLAMIKLDPQTLEQKDSRMWYINPVHAYEISAQALEKHGITKEFLSKNGVNLKDIAQEILDFLEGCDFLTYNGNSFDTKFLYFNLKQIGYELNISDRVFYDAFLMYKKLHPSTLEAVYQNYTGQPLEGAHDAFADVKATIEVFKHMHQGPNDKWEGLTRDEIDKMDVNHIYSPEGSIVVKPGLNSEQVIVFANGKHKDDEFMKVYKQDPSYVKWFLDNVASPFTIQVLREYYLAHKQ